LGQELTLHQNEKGRPESSVAVFSFQRGQVAAQPCGTLSDELELDCTGEDAGLENADVPLTAAEPASANAIKRHFVMI
jgi:hypothetical protein